MEWTPEISPQRSKVFIQPDLTGDSSMKRTEPTAEEILCELKTTGQLIAQSKTVVKGWCFIEVATDLPPLPAEIPLHASRGSQAANSAGESEGPPKIAFVKTGVAGAMIKDLAEEHFSVQCVAAEPSQFFESVTVPLND